MPSAQDLRCNYCAGTVVSDDIRPYFSWSLPETLRGQPLAHQVVVATQPGLLGPGLADCWDSGRVDGSASYEIYQGRPLSSRERCWWTVRVWDGLSEVEPEFSEPRRFEVALLPEDWRASWMGFFGNWYGQSLMMRRRLRLGGSSGIALARAYVASAGWHRFRVNGVSPDGRVLEPAESVLSKRVICSSYAIEDLLVPGLNVVGLVLGGGWYGHPCARVQVHVEYQDGSSEVFSTNRDDGDSWEVAPGAVVSSTPYGGEVLDARLERSGWDSPGGDQERALDEGAASFGQEDSLWFEVFGSPGSRERRWAKAQAVDGPVGVPTFPALPPMTVVSESPVVAVDEVTPGRYVADAGYNGTGWVRLRVPGAERGQCVVLRFGETRGPDGGVNQENLRTARAADVFVADGRGELFEPQFTSHGFRYVQIEGLRRKPAHDDIVVLRARTPGLQRTNFAGDELLERIYAMVVRTEASNMSGLLTDCPQRDERHGWLNDLTNRLESAVLAHDIGPLLAKVMDDIADSQAPDGSIPDTVPFRWGFRPADPVCLAPVLIPQLVYRHWGDGRIIERGYPVAKAWLRYLWGQSVDGVLRLTHFGDWSEPKLTPRALGAYGHEDPDVGELGNPTFAEAVSRRTPGSLVSTACLHWGLLQLAVLAKFVGDADEEARATEDALHIASKFRAIFRDPDSGAYGTGSQGSLACSLALGLVPLEERQHVFRLLASDVRRRGHLTTGNVSTKFLLETLSDNGEHDLALALARREEYPSWGYMLRKGATTLWERWEEATGGGMNSHNHGMFGSVGAWLISRHAGLRVAPDANGSDKLCVVVPGVSGDMKAAAEMLTPRGLASLRWERREGQLTTRVQVPAGTSADVRLPISEIAGAPDGVHFERIPSGARAARVGSGEWVFFGPQFRP